MQGTSQHDLALKRRCLNSSETGPYVLRKLLEDIPIRGDEGPSDVKITCIEYWNSNLYIGTSASEILHFVALPLDSTVADTVPTFILASRLHSSGHASKPPSQQPPGVRQILVLPGPAKACVLCNGVVSFYTLPELSPAFPTKEPTGVQWIGGMDEDTAEAEEPVLMIANSKRILLVKVGEKLRPIKNNIEYPGCLRSSRRGTIACVADRQSYALLEIEHQQKIPLFPISSVEETPGSIASETATSFPAGSSSKHRINQGGRDASSHSRSTSLGSLMTWNEDHTRSPSPASGVVRPHQTNIAKPRTPSPRTQDATSTSSNEDAPTSRPRASTESVPTLPQEKPLPERPPSHRPLILSPFPNEFLLTTGSGPDEPGIGMFVNLDGDVVRGTVEFDRYPGALVIDKAAVHDDNSPLRTQDTDDIVLALLQKSSGTEKEVGIESQKLSQDAAVASKSKAWISLNRLGEDHNAGLLSSLGSCDHTFQEVGQLLRLVRLKRPGKFPHPATASSSDACPKPSTERLEEEKALLDSHPGASGPDGVTPDWESRRTEEESKFATSLGFSRTHILVWSQDSIWQVQKNPEVLKLEALLLPPQDQERLPEKSENARIATVLNQIRNQEPQSEAEYLSLNYIKQKASLMIFLDLQSSLDERPIDESRVRNAENIILEGGLDPRIILLMIPPLEAEVSQGPQGLWIHQGLADLANAASIRGSTLEDFSIDFWMIIRRFLTAWQGKRGYGSIPDEKLVFDSVDAALLHVLLHLDRTLPSGTGAQTSVRMKLNNVVDHWKGNFERAVALLEDYQRLFVLSRLYQSRKLSKDVLGTWKRIVDGETDLGADKSPQEIELQARRYLVHIRDAKLVEEYSLWLATRNSALAIQLFTDDSAKVKFSPQQVTNMLKSHAPGAVQEYLEFLVFEKSLHQYADDLIGYYLDSVLNVLEHSNEARNSLTQSYSTYRALESPKPTYINFIREKAPKENWWQSRLRLLQLLGSGSYSSSPSARELTYSIPIVLERLAPYSQYLVSESIILDARQGQHKEAIKLLTHGLGDYDTAVRYCYFGGPAPASSTTIDAGTLPTREAQQELFQYLFTEFLVIEDIEDRLERTSYLLGTFATYFDPLTILRQVPIDWSVSMLSDFLLRTFRAATTEKNQAMIIKALSAAQNLQSQVRFVEVCEKIGAKLEGLELDGPGPVEVIQDDGDVAGHVQ